MKNLRFTVLAALLMTAPVMAQAPGAPAGTAPTGVTADSGAISNAATETTTSTTTTSTPGIGVGDESAMMMSETTELANTGGEPVLVVFAGLAMALGAFALRRRVTG